jgi:hypothetical protein
MRVRNVKRARHDLSPGGFRTVARFAFEPTDGVLIYDCSIVRAPDGRMLVYGPSSKVGAQTISLAPEVRRELIEMMTNEVGFDDDIQFAA